MLFRMNCFPIRGALCLRVALFLLVPLSLAAQQAVTPFPASATKAPSDDKISLSKTQTAWESIESDAAIESAVKDLLRPKFKQAMEDLQKAEEYQAAAEGFRRSIDTAPIEAKQKRDELAQLPSEQQAAKIDTVFETTADLQRELSSQNALQETLADELKTVNAELVSVREMRPADISSRMPQAEAELVETQTELQAPELSKDATSLGRIADRTVLLALEAKLQAELEMLKQEKISLIAREDLLEARSDLLTRRVANANASIATLKQQEQTRLEQEAKQAGSVVDATKEAIPQGDLAAQDLVAEVADLAAQFDVLVGQSAKIGTAQTNITDRMKRLEEEFERLSRELDVEGAGSTMAQMAFDLQNRLLDPNVFGVPKDTKLPSLESMRLSSIRVDQGLRDQASVEERFASRQSEAIDQLVKTRQELLDKLKSQYKRMIPAMITLQASRKQLQTRNEEVQQEISEELVWIRSSPPVRPRDLLSLPEGIRWLFSLEHWREFCRSLEHAFTTDPLRFVGILSVVVVLLTMRPRMIRSLEATGQGIRRVSTDRYAFTWEALIWTVLLAAPLAILLAFLGWVFGQAAETSSWMRGLADGTASAARVTFLLAFASELCRPDGLGNTHFAWAQSTLDVVRRTLFRFGVVYIPAGLIVSSTLYGDTSGYSDGIGRVSLMLSKIWTCFLLWKQFGGPGGLVSKLRDNEPHRLLTRTRVIWYPLLLLLPLALLVLAARGYVIASIELSVGFAQTIGIIFIGEVVYWMVLRWFSLRARTLAVAERMERLRAARESAGSDEVVESGEAITVTHEDEPLLDLETIAHQTRRLVRSLISVGLALTIMYVWSANFPLAQTLSAISVPLTDGIDLFELLQALLILGVTWVIVKNIPGVLELSVLRASSVDAGTRYAITTLCRYALAAIGVVAIFNVLNFDWTKFGWMAAALGVGLGFGLQEVITNFVCGLILLFERPVRLGDVVTIQGVTGTVTRIRMRATTITNWDRQEFVVPNKSLITDTILNWTLSASISRIVINVGVAYGTNTEQARQLLLDVANDHPIIMQEPPPMATFEQFADSSLIALPSLLRPRLGLSLADDLGTAYRNRPSICGSWDRDCLSAARHSYSQRTGCPAKTETDKSIQAQHQRRMNRLFGANQNRKGALKMSKKNPMLPTTWDVPQKFRDRLGSSVGRQRTMHADGHLLMVMHAPPAPDQDERQGRFFWRKPDGTWVSDQLGVGPASVMKHLAEYDQLIDGLELHEQQAKSARDYFEVMEKLAPVHRAAGNLLAVLQDARKQFPDAREVIDMRDRAYDIQRRAELLSSACKNSLDFQIARQAEEQARSSGHMAVAAHRLNLLAAFFFPLATIAGLFGMEIRSGIEKLPEPYTFITVVVIGLLIGAVLTALLMIGRKTNS